MWVHNDVKNTLNKHICLFRKYSIYYLLQCLELNPGLHILGRPSKHCFVFVYAISVGKVCECSLQIRTKLGWEQCFSDSNKQHPFKRNKKMNPIKNRFKNKLQSNNSTH